MDAMLSIQITRQPTATPSANSLLSRRTELEPFHWPVPLPVRLSLRPTLVGVGCSGCCETTRSREVCVCTCVLMCVLFRSHYDIFSESIRQVCVCLCVRVRPLYSTCPELMQLYHSRVCQCVKSIPPSLTGNSFVLFRKRRGGRRVEKRRSRRKMEFDRLSASACDIRDEFMKRSLSSLSLSLFLSPSLSLAPSFFHPNPGGFTDMMD